MPPGTPPPIQTEAPKTLPPSAIVTPSPTTLPPATQPGETPAPTQPLTSDPPTSGPSCPPCGNFGTCGQDGTCICSNDGDNVYTGPTCSELAPKPKSCADYVDCANCTAGVGSVQEVADGGCVWCFGASANDVGNRCVSSKTCQASATGSIVGCGSASVTVALGNCPNNCSGPSNGVCTNGTICVCIGDYYGADCGQAGLSAFVRGLAIGGGVIAAIIIVGLIILVAVVIGTKKAVDWAMLNNMAASHVHSNPTFVEANTDSVNPAFSPGRN